MSNLIQNILVFTALGLALAYLVRKYLWQPKKKSAAKGCGHDDCGC